MKWLIPCLFSTFLLVGCPRRQPVAHTVKVSTSLPTAGNCVTVHRNPQKNEAETLSCTDAIAVTAPQRLVVAVVETQVPKDTIRLAASIAAVVVISDKQIENDNASGTHGLMAVVSETQTTTDTFFCPKRAVAVMAETNTTGDALTCGG